MPTQYQTQRPYKTPKFPVRQAGERLQHLAKYYQLTEACVVDILQEKSDSITTDTLWDNLRSALVSTPQYRAFVDEEQPVGNRDVVDPMAAWMSIAEHHPNPEVRQHFSVKAQLHEPLQYACLSALLWRTVPTDAFTHIQQKILMLAEQWGVTHWVEALPIWETPWTESQTRRFLMKSLGVVGRHNRNGEREDDLEFIIRATTWQSEWLSIWMWIQLLTQPSERVQSQALNQLVGQNPLLALMLQYYLTGEQRFWEMARLEDPISAKILLLRFAVTTPSRRGQDETVVYNEIERLFSSKATNMLFGEDKEIRRKTEVQDMLMRFFQYKVYGGVVYILPHWMHQQPDAFIHSVMLGFIKDELESIRNRMSSEVNDQLPQNAKSSWSGDDDAKYIDPEGEDLSERYQQAGLQVIYALLEQHVPNIRRRMAFVLYQLYGSFAEPLTIPNHWFVQFQKKVAQSMTVDEIEHACNVVMMPYVDFLAGLNEDVAKDSEAAKAAYRAWRQEQFAELFQIGDGDTVRRYSRDIWREIEPILKEAL